MQPPVARAKRDRGRSCATAFRFSPSCVPPLWLLWHRLWIEAALAFAVLMLGAAGSGETADSASPPALSLLVSIFVGLEGTALRIAALRRRGWRDWGVVDADTLDDAETRYAARTQRR